MCPKKQHSALWHLGCSILAVVWLCLGRVSITPQHGHHIPLQASCSGMGIAPHHGHHIPSCGSGLHTRLTVVGVG